jgi:STE24 endopeptidase
MRTCLCALLITFLLPTAAIAQKDSAGQLPGTAMPTITTIPAAAQASPNFNADAATDAYLALIPAEAKARSDAYFEGGYWMILWDFLYVVVVMLILLNLGWSADMRNLAERITRLKPMQTLIYWVEYLVLTTVMMLPLTVYEDYFREHKYGLATQTFGPWLWDQFKGLLVGLVLGGILAMVLFGLVRRLSRSWWIWGAAVSIVFVVIVSLIGPVYIVPIFNTTKRLDDPKITQPILRMARANGIPARDVFEIDASKQTTRMSANVSGFGHTMRITLNDNLLRRGSPEEIQSVMGHEMGHYVLDHIYNGILFISVVIVIFFCVPAVVAGMVAKALGREMGNSWRGRHGGGSFCGAAGFDLLLRAHPGAEHIHTHPGARGGHVRIEREPPAGWFRAGGDSSRRIPEDEPGNRGGMDFLRSSERKAPHSRCDGVEGGELECSAAARWEHPVVGARKPPPFPVRTFPLLAKSARSGAPDLRLPSPG